MAEREQLRLRIEGVFDITGRGTAVFGPNPSGEVRRGDRVAVERRDRQPAECVWIDAVPRAVETLEDGLPRIMLLVPAWTKEDVLEGEVLVVVDPA